MDEDLGDDARRVLGQRLEAIREEVIRLEAREHEREEHRVEDDVRALLWNDQRAAFELARRRDRLDVDDVHLAAEPFRSGRQPGTRAARRRESLELRVNVREVMRLLEVRDEELPVRCRLPRYTACAASMRELRLRERWRDLAHPLGERRCAIIERDEDEALPLGDANLAKAPRASIETVGRRRCFHERTRAGIAPAVVRAHDGRAATRVAVQQRRAAVTAEVVERAELQIFAAHHDDVVLPRKR